MNISKILLKSTTNNFINLKNVRLISTTTSPLSSYYKIHTTTTTTLIDNSPQQQQQRFCYSKNKKYSKNNNNNNNNNINNNQQQQQQKGNDTTNTTNTTGGGKNKQEEDDIATANRQQVYQQLASQIHRQNQFHEASDQAQFDADNNNNNNNNNNGKKGWKKILLENAISFGVFGILSLGFAVYMSSNDETEYLIKHAPRLLKEIQSSNELSLIESRLNTLSESTANNNSMRKLMAKPENINNLLDIIDTISNIEVNIYAARIIEHAAPFIEDYSTVPRIIKMSTTPYLPTFVQKTLGVAISKIAGKEEARVILANNGAITALETLNSKKMLSKQIFHTALLAISHTCMELPNHDDLLVTEREYESMQRYAKEESVIQADTLLSTKRQLLESGWLLYLHTSAGGFLWGCFESIQHKYNLKTILTNGLKTSIITAAVPIFFVGAMTTWYNNELKKLDSTKDKFYFYFGGAYSLYPWYYLLPKIEKFSPYWLGGHVVGFMSFFIYLVISKNEIFNSDSLIIQADKKSPPREYLIQQYQQQKKDKLSTINQNSPSQI